MNSDYKDTDSASLYPTNEDEYNLLLKKILNSLYGIQVNLGTLYQQIKNNYELTLTVTIDAETKCEVYRDNFGNQFHIFINVSKGKVIKYYIYPSNN